MVEYQILHLFEHRIELFDLDQVLGELGENLEDPLPGPNLLGNFLRATFEALVLVEL